MKLHSGIKNQSPSWKLQGMPAQLILKDIAVCFPLPWSHYVSLLSVKTAEARSFYEAEALRCGWSARQLDRQISTLFYERTALSRRLRCLLVIDLKLGKFTHADAGQMHTYLNYAGEHWTHPDENPPVGLILCAGKSHALAHYALEGLPNKVLAAEYKTALPDEKSLVAEIDKTRKALEARRAGG